MILTALPGVIIGHMDLSRIKKQPNEYEGKGMAITGLVLSYLWLILSVVLIGAVIYMVMTIPGFLDAMSEGYEEGIKQSLPSSD